MQPDVVLDAKEVFLANLELIERVIESTCRRHFLTGDEVDEFRSFVHEKLIEDDYRVFRKFRGNSSLHTYLVAVIKHRFLDYRIRKWGKWRLSTQAKKLGPLAVKLETLVSRDGLSIRQAVELLAAGGSAGISRRELNRLATKLPLHPARRMEGEAILGTLSREESADEETLQGEKERTLQRAWRLVEEALAALPDEDRLVLKMHCLDGFSVAQIARVLGLRQKSLYQRVERSLKELRSRLESAGIDRDRVREVLG